MAGLALTGIDVTGRLSLTLEGLTGGRGRLSLTLEGLAGGTGRLSLTLEGLTGEMRLPILLTARVGRLCGAGLLREGLANLPTLRPE